MKRHLVSVGRNYRFNVNSAYCQVSAWITATAADEVEHPTGGRWRALDPGRAAPTWLIQWRTHLFSPAGAAFPTCAVRGVGAGAG